MQPGTQRERAAAGRKLDAELPARGALNAAALAAYESFRDARDGRDDGGGLPPSSTAARLPMGPKRSFLSAARSGCP